MGTQSPTHPSRLAHLYLWIALALLPSPPISAQTSTVNATSIPLILPSAIVFDSAANLYIAETGNHVIRKVDPQGHITTIAGTTVQGFSGDGGPATAAQLDSPQGLALAGTTFYIADTHNHRIRKLDLTTGVITTIAGTGAPGFSGDSAPATQATLNLPTALAADTLGNLYLADTANHRIRKIAAATSTLTSGTITTIAGTGTQGYSGDTGPATSAAIDSPTGLATDTLGNLYLADTHNHRIRKITAATGAITTIAGTGAPGASADAIIATASQLGLPQGLTIDTHGNLYLADTANHRIRKIDATTGLITTIAGSGTQGFSGESATATGAALDSPRAAILSSTSQLTVADTGNQRIRQLNPNLTTIAGLGSTTPGTLTLTAPSVIAYGTGQLTATLATPTTATGNITFLDTPASSVQTSSVQNTLATTPLTANTATLTLTTLNAGTHTITATYSGDLTHSPAQSTALTLTIAPAPTLTTLSIPNTLSTPITVTTQTASTTTGKPTGSIILLDSSNPASSNPASSNPSGSNPIATATLTPTGAATAIIATLAPGAHTITAAYAGDSNFQPSTSPPASFTIAVPTATDFTLTATGSTAQTIPSGNTATFSFATQTVGTLNSPITLSATGLPLGAVAAFSPAYLPPGASSNTFTLTITTAKTATASSTLLSAAILLPLLWRRKRSTSVQKRTTLTLLAIVLVPLITLSTTACGDRINTANSKSGTTSQTYPITITGTATSPTGTPIVHTTTVTLTLQ
jgi:hypothetical protein